MLDSLEKNELIQIIENLKKENTSLREELYGMAGKEETGQKQENISNEEKIKLFREVFSGRQDIYAKRWESNKTGK